MVSCPPVLFALRGLLQPNQFHNLMILEGSFRPCELQRFGWGSEQSHPAEDASADGSGIGLRWSSEVPFHLSVVLEPWHDLGLDPLGLANHKT